MATALAIAALLLLSLWGVKSLLLFSSSNGAFTHFEKAVNAGHTPGGRPLRPLTTNGRFPKLDQQIKAVCVFFLIYCEDWRNPETSLAGLHFVGAWGASWALIMLDSLRLYSQNNLLSWISIPGVIIFNYSHAIFTPLYLVFRLAFTPSPTVAGLQIDAAHLTTFSSALPLAYCVPILGLSLPSVTFRGINLKHALAGIYQQWNLYMSLCQFLLIKILGPHSTATDLESPESQLESLKQIYTLIITIAGVTFWIPVAAVLAELGRRALGLQQIRPVVRPWDVFFPPSPFGGRKAKNASEGGRWLIQWDTLTGTAATIVWAASLYFQARASLDASTSLSGIGQELFWPTLLGGPMGLPVALLWRRDEMILRGVGGGTGR